MTPLRWGRGATCALAMALGTANAAAGSVIDATLPPNLAQEIDAQSDFIDTQGEVAGYATLKQGPNGILIRVHLNGATPGWHGVHLHQVGDCSDYEDGFKASKGHINPDGKAHGLMNPDGPDLADLPNLFFGEDTSATAAYFRHDLAVRAGAHAQGGEDAPYALMDADGFAIVVHANADDHVTQPIGGAGPRIACAAFPGT